MKQFLMGLGSFLDPVYKALQLGPPRQDSLFRGRRLEAQLPDANQTRNYAEGKQENEKDPVPIQFTCKIRVKN